jgi:hypothetical protein
VPKTGSVYMYFCLKHSSTQHAIFLTLLATLVTCEAAPAVGTTTNTKPHKDKQYRMSSCAFTEIALSSVVMMRSYRH